MSGLRIIRVPMQGLRCLSQHSVLVSFEAADQGSGVLWVVVFIVPAESGLGPKICQPKVAIRRSASQAKELLLTKENIQL